MLDHQDIDQIQQRRRHLEEIAEMGHDAYPNRFDRTHTISQIVERYQSYAGKKDDEAEAARVNEGVESGGGRASQNRRSDYDDAADGQGRLRSLSDGLSRLQIYVRKNDVGDDAWALYQKLDLGDWLGVEGFLFITKTGELSVHVTRLHSWPRRCCRCPTNIMA